MQSMGKFDRYDVWCCIYMAERGRKQPGGAGRLHPGAPARQRPSAGCGEGRRLSVLQEVRPRHAAEGGRGSGLDRSLACGERTILGGYSARVRRARRREKTPQGQCHGPRHPPGASSRRCMQLSIDCSGALVVS
eukprot:scaffold330502_cov44-Prasinocladus_malaysianus.AAC.1